MSSNNMGRPLISLSNSQNKNERFKKQPKQSHSGIASGGVSNNSQDMNPYNQVSDSSKASKKSYEGGADIIRNRKHNQSSLQIAANSIIENNNNRPSQVGASGQGLPPRISDLKKQNYTQDYNGYSNNNGLMGGQNQHQILHTDGDSLTQSIEDSSGPGEIIIEKNTDDYIVDMKKGNSNILVGVRCRPLSKQEKSKQSQKSVKILDEKIIILQDVSAAKPEEAFRLARPKEKTYAFDYAFDEDRGQQYIFERTTKFLIDGIMQGYNASVFAYGSTGAGKTYTMLGTEENPGIMMLSIDELFQCIENYTAERDYKIKISYVEVYNENIKDLLTDRSDYLELREDSVKGICVAGVTEIMTTNVDEIMRYIRQGNRQRTKERTDANEASSRSHAVLQITVEHKDKAHGINAEISVAKLSLIDLAGSERASNTNNRGMRLVEGANINKSLLALGNCINALCEQTKMGPIARQNQHIPYRDSKLTRLLKDSLGGNCRTVMIANISPAFTAYEDTLNTLKYADRAKQIKTVVKRNVLNVEFHISNYTKIINQLREEIVSLRGQLSHSGGNKIPGNINSLQLQNQQKSGGSNNNNSQNQIAQNKLKSMKIEMNLQFEKEVIIKKDIYELDMKNEDLAFKLFSKQLVLTKSKNKNQNNAQLESEISKLKNEIDGNHSLKAQFNQRLTDLENFRTKMLEDYQQEMIQYEIEAIDVLYNQHLLNLKQIDFKRKENRAEFHIKQRDNYIQHLKEQLSLRDRIIKEKLGISLTNFMTQGQQQNVSSSSYNDIGMDLLSMQEIDKMSRELILPSLNMTKSSSFIPNQFNGSPLDNPLLKNKIDVSDSPYSQGFNTNINTSPNQQRAISNTISMTSKNKIAGVRHPQARDDASAYNGYTNQLKLNSANANNASNAYYHNDPKPHRQQNSSVTKPPHHSVHNTLLNERKQNAGGKQSQNANNISGNNLLNHQLQHQADLQYESDQSAINISFQSHRNNSNSRIGMGVGNAYSGLQNQLIQQQINHNNSMLPPPGTGGAESTSSQNQTKSFASEMSKNKQKFMMMQKQQVNGQLIQSPNDVFATRGSRAIPKNPLSINKKLSLLKKNAGLNSNNHRQDNGHISGDEFSSSTIPLNYQSSRNQSQNPVSRIGVGSSSLIQNSGSQIANFSIKRPSDGLSQNQNQNAYHQNSSNNLVSASVNNSIINIADNL